MWYSYFGLLCYCRYCVVVQSVTSFYLQYWSIFEESGGNKEYFLSFLLVLSDIFYRICNAYFLYYKYFYSTGCWSKNLVIPFDLKNKQFALLLSILNVLNYDCLKQFKITSFFSSENESNPHFRRLMNAEQYQNDDISLFEEIHQ